MKVIIAGGRDYDLTAADYARLDEVRAQLPITEIVSRCARGADAGGLDWAVHRGIPVTRFPQGWDRQAVAGGTQLPPEMAEYADAVIAFPGGPGTSAIVMAAEAQGLSIIDWRHAKGRRGPRSPDALDRLAARVKNWFRRKLDERAAAKKNVQAARVQFQDRREPTL